MIREQRRRNPVHLERLAQVGQGIVSERMHLKLCELLDDLRSFDFEQRDLGPRSAGFRRDRRKHTQVRDLERHELELDLRDAIAEAGILDQRAAVMELAGCNFLEPLQCAFAIADAGIIGALVREQEFCVSPALVFLADQVFHRHLHVVEENIVDFVFAVDRDDGAHRDARRFHIDQQERNALLWTRVAAEAHQAEDPIGILAERVPGLLAVDAVMSAFAHRAGAQRCEIGARTGLRIPLAPPVLAGNDARQKVILLCGSCEAHEHRGDHAQRERDLWRRAGRRTLFVEDVLLDDAPIGTAVAPRPHAGAPAAAVEDLLPAHEVVFVHSPSQAHFGADVGRKLGFEESTDFGAKGVFFGGVVEIHEGFLIRS